MRKLFIILLLTCISSSMVMAKCPSKEEDIQGWIYCQNNNFFVPEQWGFRSGKTVKENYQIDMQLQHEYTKSEWNNTYNPKPIHSNYKNVLSDVIIYPNQFKVFRIPRQVTRFLP